MQKPEAFVHPHVAFRNTPYLGETSSRPDPDNSPTLLTRGEIIWTRSRFALGEMPARTVAYVEHLGLISLDPRWLVPTAKPAKTPHSRPMPIALSPRSVPRSVS